MNEVKLRKETTQVERNRTETTEGKIKRLKILIEDTMRIKEKAIDSL